MIRLSSVSSAQDRVDGSRWPAKCHYRPPGAGARAVFRTVFSVAFTVRFVTFSVVMGDGKGGLVPLPKRTHAEEASHDHPEDGPGPTDSDVHLAPPGAWPLAQVVVLEGASPHH